jgi:hypothetical protein
MNELFMLVKLKTQIGAESEELRPHIALDRRTFNYARGLLEYLGLTPDKKLNLKLP